jgi:hypothetical protein
MMFFENFNDEHFFIIDQNIIIKFLINIVIL